MVELTAEIGEAVAELDACIAAIGDAFDEFIRAANRCEQVQTPVAILNGKALELQAMIAQRMMGG